MILVRMTCQNWWRSNLTGGSWFTAVEGGGALQQGLQRNRLGVQSLDVQTVRWVDMQMEPYHTGKQARSSGIGEQVHETAFSQ